MKVSHRQIERDDDGGHGNGQTDQEKVKEQLLAWEVEAGEGVASEEEMITIPITSAMEMTRLFLK